MTESKKVTDYINEYADKMQDIENLKAEELSKMLVGMTAWRPRVAVAVAEAETKYKIKRAEIKDQHATAAESNVYAEATPEFGEYKIRKAWEDSLNDMISSIKRYLSIREEELRHGR